MNDKELALRYLSLQNKKTESKIVPKFGWDETNHNFAIGREVIKPLGFDNAEAIDQELDCLMDSFTSRGSIQRWSIVTQLLSEPDMEIHAFALFCAFGAPLVRLSEHGAAMVKLYPSNSKIDYGSIIGLANAVYGNPDLMQNSNDLHPSLSKAYRMGNLPVFYQRQGYWRLNTLMYGKDKCPEILKDTILMTAGRSADVPQQYLNPYKHGGPKYLALPIVNTAPKLNKIIKNEVIGRLYGIIGKDYIRSLVSMNFNGELSENVKLAIKSYPTNFGFGFRSNEKHILTLVACAWVGAKYAQTLGLISQEIDIHAVFFKINQIIDIQRGDRINSYLPALSIIERYVIQHERHFIKVKHIKDKRAEYYYPSKLKIYGRINFIYETKKNVTIPRSGLLRISLVDFNAFCEFNKLDYEKILAELFISKYFTKISKATLSSGLTIDNNGNRISPLHVECLTLRLPNSWLSTYYFRSPKDGGNTRNTSTNIKYHDKWKPLHNNTRK